MKLRILIIFLAVCSAFLTFCQLYSLPNVKSDVQIMVGHTSNPIEGGGINHTVVKAPPFNILKRFRLQEATYMKNYYVYHEFSAESHLEYMGRYNFYANYAFYGVNAGLSNKYCNFYIIGQVSLQTIANIRQYKNLLREIQKKLWECRFMYTSSRELIKDHALQFIFAYELFKQENVNLYKGLCKNLNLGHKQESMMVYLDMYLIVIIKMTNLCISKYKFLRENDPSLLNIAEHIDVSSNNNTLILEQGMIDGRYSIVDQLKEDVAFIE